MVNNACSICLPASVKFFRTPQTWMTLQTTEVCSDPIVNVEMSHAFFLFNIVTSFILLLFVFSLVLAVNHRSIFSTQITSGALLLIVVPQTNCLLFSHSICLVFKMTLVLCVFFNNVHILKKKKKKDTSCLFFSFSPFPDFLAEEQTLFVFFFSPWYL